MPEADDVLGHLLVRIHEKHHSQNFTVAIRQLYRGQEVALLPCYVEPSAGTGT